MKNRTLSIALLLGSATLAGCATPFAQDSGIDWKPRRGIGHITISEPKMYRREALINERRKEMAWLDQQLTDSEKIAFKPEIVRELETITAFSAALGLKFDPAAGLNYRRAAETGELQQEISTMRLQLQLDQLKRDAELVREKFAAQTEPVNENLGTLGDGSVGTASSLSGVDAADQLKAAIDRLKGLTDRIDAETKAINVTPTESNPADLFRDRAAYRDLLKGARNAASLDELHDLDGAALIRLNFQATMIPDPAHPRSPGVIQMKIEAPHLNADEQDRLYAGWLAHINETLNQRAGDGWRPDWRVLNSAAADNFDTLLYYYPITADASGCAGPVIGANPAAAPVGCGTLYLAVPWFKGVSQGEGAFQTLQTYLEEFQLPQTMGATPAADAADLQADLRAREALAAVAPALAANCGLADLERAYPAGEIQIQELRAALGSARIRLAAGEALQQAVRAAERQLSAADKIVPQSAALELIRARTRRAQLFVASFEGTAFRNEACRSQLAAFKEWRPRRLIPPNFAKVLDARGPAEIYELGPREQVQQVSTVARAANSLALAVSLAASAPGSGVAGNAAGNYSRQAMGKAAQLERLPAAVGFANQATETFGWVLGPRATVDPKGRLEVAHALRPYDLSVDVSIPGWWPHFTLLTTKGLGPSVQEIAGGEIGGRKDKIVVRMSPNSADYAAISGLLARADAGWTREVRLGRSAELLVSACRATTLLIKGDNVWRASAVLVEGHKLDDKAITIAPDMSGILLDVPALDSALGDRVGDTVSLAVLTPYGDETTRIHYEKKAGDACKPEKKAAKDGASVSSVTPLRFRAPADIIFEYKGEKLEQATRITLNGQPGELRAATGEGKNRVAVYTAGQTAGLPISRNVKLILFKGDEAIDERMIEVTGNQGGE